MKYILINTQNYLVFHVNLGLLTSLGNGKEVVDRKREVPEGRSIAGGAVRRRGVPKAVKTPLSEHEANSEPRKGPTPTYWGHAQILIIQVNLLVL